MRSPLKRDDGQMSLAVVSLALVVLMVGVGLMIFGQASDSRGKAQKAADAAALAAATEMRYSWIGWWLRTQPPPKSPVDWGPARGPSSSTPSMNAGRGAANEYAAQNDNSSVTSYRQFPSGTSVHRVTVDTLAEKTDVSGTADRLVGTPQAEATATAEVRAKAGIICRKQNVIWPPKSPTVISWEVICSAPGVGSATVGYIGPVPMSASYDPDDFAKFFDIRLVD
ncbi:pilus assembly protein TadG-related protein [Sediminivirga luteola]|uniref:Putative Flp pilus-assembly TadG-like N-terminal domain-containing protein n=2 Tax=Sediminivirga luteola TaxID=1774748 RepID=A0A8J2TXQ4_9MICO|nr:pilus assembly protein TadG-related protein [Sediminivirga luteola]GGA13406.1 hypothetical protein GCM10011333_15460 [Sediminivirga luteola]